MLLIVFAACNDYDLKNSNDVTGTDTAEVGSPGDQGGGDGGGPGLPGGSDGGDDDGGSTDDSGGDGGSPGGGDSDPPDEPPPEVSDECPDSVSVSMDPGEIYVLSWDPVTATATLTSSAEGLFHVYDTSISESGSSQWNETGYVRISNAANPTGEPVYANCGTDWVVVDADNYGALPDGSRIYIGTFWLDAGSNTLTLYHYCPRYRAGECPEGFHNTDTSDTCDGSGVNSVHIVAKGLCVTPAE